MLTQCGNKLQTRCNRGSYCRSYCLLNVFRTSLCPSSGAQEYYTVVALCGISCCGFQVAGLVWSCSILQTRHITLSCSILQTRHITLSCSILQTGHITLSSKLDQQLENHSLKYHRQQTLYNTLELLMMGVVVPRNMLSKQ